MKFFTLKRLVRYLKTCVILVPISVVLGCAYNSNPTQSANSDLTEALKSHSEKRDNRQIISAQTAVHELGLGINLGNSLDAPSQDAWGAQRLTRDYIQDIAKQGFTHVRLPATWDNQTAKTPPYEVDPARLERMNEIIGWALAENLYVIINAHHEIWLKKNYSEISNQQRFDAIWQQLIARFGNQSPKVIFEMLNEPHGMTVSETDDVNTRILKMIRKANPTRLAIYAGNNFSALDQLLEVQIPDRNDPYLIANYHSYEPWPFAGECTRRWGSQKDKDALEKIYKRAATWSSKHNIPITVNEFGAARYDFTKPHNQCNPKDRKAYLIHHVTLAKKYGVAPTLWDDDGSFSIYSRVDKTWSPIKDAIIEAYAKD